MRPLLFSLAIAALATGCGTTPEQQALDDSRDAWDAALADSDGSYTYVRYSSYWTGERATTTVTVEDGAVIERSYVFTNDDVAVAESWTEVGAEIGSHETGHPAVTLDALYDQCAADVLPHDEDHIDITFELFEDGVLKSCYFVDQSVEDSGAEGVQLESIELGPQTCGVASLAPCG